jgi:SAM-dependent methyltransferase
MTVVGGTRVERIEALAFDYAAQPKHRVERCNLCGAAAFVGITHRDRYGYPAPAACCMACGLVFLDPLMTAEAYAAFYASTYRPLVSAYHGRLIDARTIQDEQRQYASECAALLAHEVGGRGYTTLLDIGGSTGVVADVFARQFGLRATLVDPAPPEAAEAQTRGIETIEGLIEHVDLGDRRFDVVVLCQTVDHLLDIAGTLRRVRQLLNPTGLLFLDIVDFRAAYLRHWSVEEAIKIDHPYYLTEPTIAAFLRRAGFVVARADYAADHLHVGYAARTAAPDSAAVPSADSVRALLHEVRFVQNGRRP